MKFNLDGIKELRILIQELSNGLFKLQLRNNFEGFEVTETIAANTEVKIRNKMNFIPSRYLIVDKDGGEAVARGSTTWTSDYLYIKNYDATNAVVVTVQFLR